MTQNSQSLGPYRQKKLTLRTRKTYKQPAEVVDICTNLT